MPDFLSYLLAFIATLGVLVTVHEYGHYVVARWSGVRILRFAVGMGPAVWRRVDRRGTEFALCAFPIGGYVRMHDERDSESAAPPGGAPGTPFNRLPVRWRIAIALGGPVANLLLAVGAYAVIGMLGVTTVLPLVGAVAPDGAAERAGLQPGMEIRAIDAAPVRDWQNVQLALAERLGESGEIVVEARIPGSRAESRHVVPIRDWLGDARDPDLLAAIGVDPELPAVVGEVLAGQPAAVGGMRDWDRVVAIDGTPVDAWGELVEAVRAAAGRTLRIGVERAGSGPLELWITPEAVQAEDGSTFGRIGIALPIREVRYGPVDALSNGVERTIEASAMTLQLIGKMLQGLVSSSNLSGPITIARVAGDSMEAGSATMLSTLALLSVSLAVLNLLPIPVLDGGHILYCIVEVVAGRAASERFQLWGAQAGVLMVVGLMVLAFYNDIVRLL